MLQTIQVLADTLKEYNIPRKPLPAEELLGFSPSIMSTGNNSVMSEHM